MRLLFSCLVVWLFGVYLAPDSLLWFCIRSDFGLDSNPFSCCHVLRFQESTVNTLLSKGGFVWLCQPALGVAPLFESPVGPRLLEETPDGAAKMPTRSNNAYLDVCA